jgi:hypothetical protein
VVEAGRLKLPPPRFNVADGPPLMLYSYARGLLNNETFSDDEQDEDAFVA